VTDDEAEALYQRLADALIGAGFGWVRDQVADYVAVGRLEAVEVSTPTKAPPFIEAVQTGWQEAAEKRNRFIRAVPFTPSERLDIMLEAISHVTIEFPAMLAEASRRISSDSSLVRIELVQESGRRIEVSNETAISRTEQLDRLMDRIAATRAELT
jgi:hypothetical protein